MDQSRFDQATKVWFRAAGSRRAALGRVAAAALGGAVGAVLAPAAGSAKRKKRKKKKKGPTLQLAFDCPGPGPGLFQVFGTHRIGQVFAATRSGTLRQVRFDVNKPASSTPGDYLVQLLTASGSPAVPDHSPLAVIAAVTVPDGSVPEGDSTLVATFAGTEVVQGTAYGVVVSRPGSNNLWVWGHSTDFCAGERTLAEGAGAFDNDAGFDAVLSVLVD